MKAHTNDFKTNIKTLGRELDAFITYELNGETITLDSEKINSINIHYQGDILKSIMRQVDIDTNENIPLNTIINCQAGIKVGNSYEYMNYGNYIVYKSEKQEDVNSYKLTCYDKMLYSMVDYETLGINYPITIRDYINAICTKLGLTFKNANSIFANYNRQIATELYLDSEGNSLGYTFRDVLDELAQVTASTICINEADDELEIRYITSTNDTIDEDFIKDTNVNFGEKYGPINSIVLSRSADTDNVYLSDEQSIAQNGLCEIKISDNQIMNGNDRNDYLPDILSTLGGLEYYLNNFSSIGILYYELCDRYTIQIGTNQYSCVMFNDDINITQGINEEIFTEMPQESETDYSKSDKTDRKINQTYLIVDKQNQTIQSVVSSVGEQDNKISQLTQTVDQLSSEISNVTGMVMTKEGNSATVTFEDTTNASEIVSMKVHPIINNISYLYPRNNLYPSDTLYITDRVIRFHNNTTSEDFYLTLPDDLLYYDSTHYDEFYMDLKSDTYQVTKKCKYNDDGNVSLLSSEQTDSYTYEHVDLTEGVYSVYINGYSNGYLSVSLMAKNIYTDQFYTKVETDSKITQKADEITAGVNQTLTNYSTTTQMNSAITLKANEINSSVAETYATKSTTNTLSSRINQTAKSIALSVNNGSTSSGITITTTKEDGTTATASGTIQMTGLVKFTDLSTSGATTINGANITTGTISTNRLDSNVITTNNFSAQSINADKITVGILSVDRIQTKSITESKIADSTISGGKIATGTITGTNIASATITNSKIADATITSAKISSLSASKITTGSLTSSNVKIGSWNLNGTGINSSNAQIYPTYLGYKNDSNAWTSVSWKGIGKAGTAYSDKKLKKNIKPLEEQYNKFFDDLKPVSFKWKSTKYKTDDKEHIGFIAQDIQEAEKNNGLDLDLVYKTDDILNLDKRELIALNTWQIQKLKQENKELKSAIDELRQEIEKLKKGK